MKDIRRILKSPVITEKSTLVKDLNNVVVFAVDRGVNKSEIKRSVEDVFKVKVNEVRTVNVAGKRKRTRTSFGKRSNWKKAYVTLAEGESIDIFEGV